MFGWTDVVAGLLLQCLQHSDMIMIRRNRVSARPVTTVLWKAVTINSSAIM